MPGGDAVQPSLILFREFLPIAFCGLCQRLEMVGARLTKLTDAQATYIGVGKTGPFKGDLYRY